MKKGSSEWTRVAYDAFEKLKTKLHRASVLAIPNFDKLFDIDCDASGVGIAATFMQDQRPSAYFSEKPQWLRKEQLHL